MCEQSGAQIRNHYDSLKMCLNSRLRKRDKLKYHTCKITGDLNINQTNLV